jgi:hypothetical protein
MSKNVVSHEEGNAVRDGLLSIGAWQIGLAMPPDRCGVTDFADIATFASGDSANNKLIADMPLQQHSEAMRVPEWEFQEVRRRVLDALGSLLNGSSQEVDTLWGVPSGGQSYAETLAYDHGLQFVRLAKVLNQPGLKTYRPATPDDAAKLSAAKHMMGFEDAGNEGTSPYGALFGSDEHGLGQLREKTVGLSFLWVRGRLQHLKGIGAITRPPIRTVVREPMPNRIKSSDPFYRRFGQYAVTVEAV